MRITIDIDQAGQVILPGVPPQDELSLEMDGGTPSPALLAGLPGSQVTGLQSASGEPVGGPPDWLVRDIESAMAAEMASGEPAADSNESTDGGPSPA